MEDDEGAAAEDAPQEVTCTGGAKLRLRAFAPPAPEEAPQDGEAAGDGE